MLPTMTQSGTQSKSLTVDDIALSPWISFAEIVVWSLVPVMLINGKGWTVVGGAAAICIVSLLVSIVCKAWWGKVPLAGRGGYGLDE